MPDDFQVRFTAMRELLVEIEPMLTDAEQDAENDPRTDPSVLINFKKVRSRVAAILRPAPGAREQST